MICERFFFFMQTPFVNLEKLVFWWFYTVLSRLCKPICKTEIKIKSRSLPQIRTVQ
jgi:hypothetical protein